MKKAVKMQISLLLVLLFVLLLSGCKTKTVYLPVENIKTEYQDRWLRDSVYLRDSVLVKLKGDTVWVEKYSTIYKERIKRDSVFKTDSLRIPYPVEVEKEVNRLNSFQAFQVWCGRILLVILLGYFGYLLVRKKFF